MKAGESLEDPDGEKVKDDLIGLSLSGGGIRSAMFNLGLLQAFWRRGVLPQIDYLATVSGGGYVGSRLTQAAATWSAEQSDDSKDQSRRATKSDGDPKGAVPWFPFDFRANRPVAANSTGPRQIYNRGDYLNDPFRFFFQWLPGMVINLVIVLSMLAIVASAAAWIFRAFDHPWVDSGMRGCVMQMLMGLRHIGVYLGIDWSSNCDTSRPRNAFIGQCCVLATLLVLWIALLGLAFSVRRHLGPSRFKRMARGILTIVVACYLFVAAVGFTSLLRWPQGNPKCDTAGYLSKDKDVPAKDPQNIKQPTGMEFNRTLSLSNEILKPQDPTATDHLRKKRARELAQVVEYLVDEDPWYQVRALKSWERLKDDPSQAGSQGRNLVNRLITTLAVLRAESPDGVVWSFDRVTKALRSIWIGSPDQVVKGFEVLDSPDITETITAQAKILFWPASRDLIAACEELKVEPVKVFDGTPSRNLGTFRESMIALETSSLIVTDLTRAMIPALIFSALYGVLHLARYVLVDMHPRNNGRLRWLEGKLGALSWIAALLGIFVLLGNGDTDIGGFKYLRPDAWNNISADDSNEGILPSARYSLQEGLQAFIHTILLVPTAIAAALALVPILAPGKFLQSSERPRDSVQGLVYRLVVGSFILVFPLAAFFFLARENVSGAAPSKTETATYEREAIPGRGEDRPPDASGLATDPNRSNADEPRGGEPGQVPVKNIARMAYCPAGLFTTFGYLIQNDQAIRGLIFFAGLAVFFILGTLSNVNRSSIHYFYREKLRETYLNWDRDIGRDKTVAERPDYRKLKDQRGSEVGAPYHILSATLNVIVNPTERRELKEIRHNFIFSPLYCGSKEVGFRRTDKYHGGVDLADAIAISGGAISPIQGLTFGGRFWMVLLNARLGQWYANPNPKFEPWSMPTIPSLMAEYFFHSWKKRGHYFLSDGAHRDNLGLELLLLRRCRLIIVSDVSHDPKYELNDLIRDLRRARIWEGIQFRPLSMKAMEEAIPRLFKTVPSAAPLFGLDQFSDDVAAKAAGKKYTRENFFLIQICYPSIPPEKDGTGGEPARDGLLIVVKPSLSARFPTPGELEQHYKINPSFPHDPDLEQIYEEDRIEAYRQLGEHIGISLSNGLSCLVDTDADQSFASKRASFFELSDRILKAAGSNSRTE
ncbi:hypothetical protein EP7_003290 [Isosphaeraceae bacterium EP7]